MPVKRASPGHFLGGVLQNCVLVPASVSGTSVARRYRTGSAGDKTGSRQFFHLEPQCSEMSRREPNPALQEEVRTGSQRCLIVGVGRGRVHPQSLTQCHRGPTARTQFSRIPLLHTELRLARPFTAGDAGSFLYVSHPVLPCRRKG